MGTSAIISAFFGFFFGLCCYLILSIMGDKDALAWAAVSGVGSTLLLSIIIPIAVKYEEKKYAELEKMINSPIVEKTNGNVYPLDGRMFNANIYFCDSAIVFMDLGRKDSPMYTIEKNAISGLAWGEVSLDITTVSGMSYLIMLPNAVAVHSALTEKGWSYRE